MKKTLSLFLSVIMLITTTVIPAVAEDAGVQITAYVTVSKYGEIIDDKNGDAIAMMPVELTGQDSYDLTDVFTALHDECYDGGAESGYATATGDYGLYISKFWGDDSANFNYMINSAYAWGPTDTVNEGDHIEFSINRNTEYEDLEVYTKFDTKTVTVYKNEDVELTLTEAGYTADGLVFSACPDATLTVDTTATESVTDADGKASLTFDIAGRYVVSATKTKTVGVETVTAIIAPVCIINVLELPETAMHNIVEKYVTYGITEDTNMHWFVADLADYLTLYPESGYALSETQKQECVDKIIEGAASATSQGDLAKAIIALRALGYDAKNTYTKDGEALDIVTKLTNLITEESVTAPYYEFTLPYVLMALEQGEGYDADGKISFLIETALSIKSSWQSTAWGTDGATPMLRALAPYDENPDVKAAIDETVELVKAYQGNNGSMGNTASTGLAIAGLASVGVDPETVEKNGKDILYGLMYQSNDTFDGFEPTDSSFATEQGLRGLIAWKLFAEGKYIYDFVENPMNEARATLEVVPTPTPTPVPTRIPSYGGGGVRVTPTPKPTATPTPTPAGLPGKNSDVVEKPIVDAEKTFEDIKGHENQTAIEALASRAIIDGMDDTSYCPDNTMTRAQFAAIVVRALGVPTKDGYEFTDVNESDWFYSYVNTAYHYGIINGVSDTEFNPNGEITREEAATMTARAAKLCGMKTDYSEEGTRNTLAMFPDYTTVSDWAMPSMAFCYYEGLLDDSELNIEPKTKITRAEMAQILYNMLGKAKLI